MRRTLLLAFIAAQAAIPAQAATHATVIARPARSVAVVALADGTLARVRLPRGTALAVGRRVDVSGRRNTFDTLVARVVRTSGRAGRFRIAGTVVGLDGDAFLVASGGAVARVVATPLPAVGSGVRVTVRLRDTVVVADRTTRRAAPARLRLAGVVSAIGSGLIALRLPGGANIAVGSGGRDVSWLKPGDAVVLDVTRRGARLALRRYGLLAGRDAFAERPRGEIIGQVGNVDGASLVLARPGRPDTRVALDAPSAAAGARNGDTVLVDRRAAGDPAAAHVIVLGRAVPAAPPAIELRSAPPATTPATTVVVEWSARGSVDRQLCSLDGAAWSACTSPHVVKGLAPGAHVVAIVAGNAAGWAPRTDVRFTVAPPLPAAPVVTITGGAPPTGYATSASFPFTVTGSAASVLCSLDGAAWTACSSPRSVSALAVGPHVFAVTAGNAGGWNVANRAFAVLAAPTAPSVVLTQQPAASTDATSAVFSWTTTGTVDTTECRVDGGAYAACSTPLALNALALGAHTLDVRASNAGGAGLASAAWSIVPPPPGAPTVTITSAPGGSTTATSATITFTTTGTAVSTTCSLDGGAAAACTSPRGYAALALGSHTVAVVATNGGGTTTATAAWTVVPAPPGLTITSAPAGTVTVATAAISWTTTGTVTATTCSLDGGPFAPCSSPAAWSALGVGAHAVVVRASNSGGATEATVSWTIAVSAPTVAISSAPPPTTPATSATIAWITTGTVTTTTCSLDGGGYAACASPAVLTGLATGTHVYTVRVANAGGYATASAAWSVTDAPPPPAPPVNTGLPVISGVAQSRKTVTATTGSWSGGPDTFTFQWLRCTNATSVASCTAVAGATAASYTAATADIDTYLRVQVAAANAGGTVTAVSAATPKTMPS